MNMQVGKEVMMMMMMMMSQSRLSSPQACQRLLCFALAFGFAGTRLSATLRFLFPSDVISESAGKKAIRRGFVILNGLAAKVTDVIQVCQGE